MKITIAADHAGYQLKQKLAAELVKKGYDVFDLTPQFKDGDDYPHTADVLAKNLGPKEKGVLICGSGIGVCIAANRHKGIRAGTGHDVAEVKLAREHNDINVLCLSGWKTKLADATKLIETFLKTKASNAARHKRRIRQLG